MKKKDKILMFFALNLLITALGHAKEMKYDRLYSKVISSNGHKKSSKKNYKLIEQVLYQKNKELKDLYLQSDYIVKPEYLEWQIFFSGFYESNHRKDNNGEKEAIDQYEKKPKVVSLGMYVPVRDIKDSLSIPNVKTNNLTILNSPNLQNAEARDVSIFNIDIPQISLDVTLPIFNITTPVVTEKNIKLTTNLNAPQVPLQDIKIFNLKLNSQTNPMYINGTSVPTTILTPSSPYDIVLKVSAPPSAFNGIYSNVYVERTKSSAVLLEKGFSIIADIYGNVYLKNNETSGLSVSPYNTESSYNSNSGDYKIENAGNIIGEKAATGVYTKQIGIGYIPSGAKNIQVEMVNNINGIITMYSPNSAGFLLMPDVDQDLGNSASSDYQAYIDGGRVSYDGGLAYADVNSYDQMNVRQIALNQGIINVYGSRSYGFLTSPYEGNNSEHNFGISTRYSNTSRIANTGVINVLGDESTGFAIKKGIQHWVNEGIINIGNSSSSIQDNENSNTVYKEDGTIDLIGDPTKIERATGMYTNQDTITYTSDLNSGGAVNFYENLTSSAENSATINIWENAVESSGLRAELSGYVVNRGSINIWGDNNYGIVARDGENSSINQKGGRIYNITYTHLNPGIYNSITNEWEVQELAGKLAQIDVHSKASAGGFVDRGGFLYNTGYMNVIGENSVGFYVKSGRVINDDMTNDPLAYHYGKILITNKNSHGVLVTNEDALGANFENRGIIQTTSEGSVAVYAVNSSYIIHSQSEDKERHFVEDINSPGNSVTVTDWLLNGGTLGNGYEEYMGRVTLTTDYKQNALIKAGDGGTGIWLEQKNPNFTPTGSITGVTNAIISAPIEVGNSTVNYNSIGVYSDGIATATFKKGNIYDLDSIKYYKDIASIKVGTGGIALLHNYKENAGVINSRKRFGSSSGTFEINELSANLGNDSILAYSNGGDILTGDLSGVKFTNLGNNVTLTYSSNNGSITVNDTYLSDFLLNTGGVFVGIDPAPYISENGEVKNIFTGTGASGINGLVLNTKMGLQSYSKNGTLVTMNKVNTKTTNDGILNMKGNTSGVVATYTKYGNLTNTINGVINTNEMNSTGMFGLIDSDIVNNGTINILGTGSVAIYSLSNDTSGTPLITTGGINITNTGTISTLGNESAGIYAKKNGIITLNNKINNSGIINVNSKDSVGIYADNVNVIDVGLIDISNTLISTNGDRIAVYGKGVDSIITTTGANIRLGEIDQTQVAYYIADGAKLSGANIGTVNGYGVLILADSTVIGAGIPNVTAGNGQIGLALKGTNTIAYTGEIKSGNTVIQGTDKFYSIALYADKQNIASLTNKLTAGTNGVGLYAGGGTGVVGSGSDITYTGQIEVGNGTNSGIGIYVKAGSRVNLASGGSIKVDGLGVGAYVEGNGEFTFGTGSNMTFTDSGIGIWGENGSIINDDGSAMIYSLSLTGSVTRSRVANGIINITGPLTMLGSGMAGFVTSGEVNNLSNSTIMSNVGTQGTTALAAEGYKTVGVNVYEANNFGIINLQNTNKGTGIYVKNARTYNDSNAEISVGQNGVGIYGESDLPTEKAEIRNNGNILMTGIQSIGLYGKGASLIENNGVLFSNISGNIGIYNKENTIYPLLSVINNNNNIILSDNGIGIYAEKSTVKNAGNIITGDKSGAGESIGIYVKDSTVINTGDIKVGQNGVAFIGDNSIININGGNIDVSSGSLVYGKNNSTINYNIGNTTVKGVPPYISIEDSILNFISPTTLTVADNGTGIFVSGNTGVITGSLNLDINNDAIGMYVKDLGIIYTSNVKIDINGAESRGLVLENSSVLNTGSVTINREKGVGVFSQLTQLGNNTTLENTGVISVNAEGSKGIYALSEDNAGTVLGSTVIDNNGIITLGNSADINTSTQVGIYGTKAVTINNNSVITGGANTVGIYSTGSTVSSNGSISVGDSSVGIYLDNGNLTTGLTTSISTGNNNGVAIYALNGSQVINKSNNISAGKDSILIYAKGSSTFINNLADLQVQENGVGFYINGGTVQNQGVLKATGSNAIFLYGAAGEILNSNLLNADGNAGVIGIYGKNTTIQNTGDVITGNSVITSVNPKENTYSVGIYGNNSSVKNSGKITLASNAVGIYVHDALITAENTGLIESNQHGVIGIFADNGTVQNKGTIILSGNNSIGMAGRANSKIINDGQIIINGNDGIGMYVTAGSHVYNNNNITINGDNGIGIQVGGGSILENRGIINLNGVNGQDILVGEGEVYTLPNIINAGIINVNEKFEVSGINISIKVDPSTVRVPTIAEIASGGYNSDDLEGKFLISNAVQFNAESFDMREPINIMDSFTQGTNSTVYKLENVFSSATAWAGSNGNISIISDSLTWDAIPSINDKGGVDIWMQKLEYTRFSKDHWYNDFAKILDGKYEYAKGNAMKIYDKIDNIKLVKDFDHIMNSLSGNIYANINQRENDMAKVFEESLHLLQNSTNNTKENIKISVIAGKGKNKEETDGVVSYDYSTTGILALREVERTYKHTFGYSLGYLHTGFEFKDGNESEEWVDTIQLGVHNKYKTNEWKIVNDLTGRASIHNVDRNIDWPSPNSRSEMNGSYETYSIISDNILGKEFELGKKASIMPYGAFRAMYVTRPTFNESGLEALKVGGNDAWSVKPRAGIELKGVIPIGVNWELKGTLDFAYEYELTDLNEREKARLIAIEDGYHKLSKPEDEKRTFRTKTAIGVEVEDRYGIFLTGEYSIGNDKENDYRAGVTLKAVF